MKRNSSLDTLRGIAVLMVIALHCVQAFETIHPSEKLSSLLEFIAANGALGVQLFFIISGYTMMLTFGKIIRKETVFAFYIRRFFRIAPLFWIAGICYLLKDGFSPRVWAPNGIDWQEILLTFSFLHWLSPQAFNSVVPGGWSIAVEVQFYILFPIFASIFIKSNYKSITPYLLISLIYVFSPIAGDFLFNILNKNVQNNEAHLIIGFFYFWLPKQILCFGLGFLLFNFFEKKYVSFVGIGILVVPALFTNWGVSVVFIFIFVWLVLVFNINLKPISIIGLVSYSMYLIHIAVIGLILFVMQRYVNSIQSFGIIFILVTALSLGLSLFIIKPFIEDPLINLGKRLSGNILSKIAI